MKKILLFSFVLLVNLFAIAQTPVAYYPFNGNANDAIGINHGTPTNGASLTTDRFGKANSAYSFDGVDDGIFFASLPMTNTNNFTLMAWVNPAVFDPANQFNRMIINIGTGVDGYNMGMGNSNGIGNGSGLGGLYNLVSWLNSGSVFPTINTWYHVVMVRETVVTKFYLNGTQTPNTFNATPNVPTALFEIGGQGTANTHDWNGKIDEVKIYNVALTALQIQQEYASSSEIQKPGSGNALSFDGFDDGIEVTNSAALQFPGDLSVECWVKIPPAQNNNANVDNAIIEKWGGNNAGIGYPFVIRYIKTNQTVQFVRYNGSASIGVDGVTIVGDNKWHHLAATKTGTVLSWYVDGILQGTTADFADLSNINNNQNLNIGTRGPIAAGPNNLTGQIDEVRIWSVGMTQTQIRDRMCKKITFSDAFYSNLVAYYNFDESTGTVAFDGTINANNGTLANSPTRVTSGAAIGNASSHDYVNTTKTVSLTHATGENFTVTSTSGSPAGIHVYMVDEKPNTLTGASGVGHNNKYFGVFQVGGAAPQYTAVYNYNGNPFVTPAIESQLRLNKRIDNAAASWTVMSAIPDEPSNSITVTGESTEYILGQLSGSLPLKLISFMAHKQQQSVSLNWKTDNEINTSHFDVERSVNGIDFKKIGTVTALNRSGINQYSFEDVSPSGGVNLYRLRQVDIDAKFEYSNTVKILFSSKINITIYPNPVVDKLKIQIPGSSLKWMSSIYDAAGKLVYQQVNTAAANLVEINITALAKGNYVLVLNSGLETFTAKFLKQ